MNTFYLGLVIGGGIGFLIGAAVVSVMMAYAEFLGRNEEGARSGWRIL